MYDGLAPQETEQTQMLNIIGIKPLECIDAAELHTWSVQVQILCSMQKASSGSGMLTYASQPNPSSNLG